MGQMIVVVSGSVGGGGDGDGSEVVVSGEVVEDKVGDGGGRGDGG